MKLNERGLDILVEEVNKNINTKINEAIKPTRYITRGEFDAFVLEVNNNLSEIRSLIESISK